MDDFYEQAQAIWKTLDSLSEQDPEAYKKFISEQLKQGQSMFGNKNINKIAQAKSSSGDGSDHLKRETPKNVLDTFSKLSLMTEGKGSTPGKRNDQSMTSIERGEKKCVKKAELTRVLRPSSGGGDADDGILDDEIGKKPSMLASIVTKSGHHSSTECKDDGDDEVGINELIIPSLELPTTIRNTNKPLIEEL